MSLDSFPTKKDLGGILVILAFYEREKHTRAHPHLVEHALTFYSTCFVNNLLWRPSS